MTQGFGVYRGREFWWNRASGPRIQGLKRIRPQRLNRGDTQNFLLFACSHLSSNNCDVLRQLAPELPQRIPNSFRTLKPPQRIPNLHPKSRTLLGTQGVPAQTLYMTPRTGSPVPGRPVGAPGAQAGGSGFRLLAGRLGLWVGES